MPPWNWPTLRRSTCAASVKPDHHRRPRRHGRSRCQRLCWMSSPARTHELHLDDILPAPRPLAVMCCVKAPSANTPYSAAITRNRAACAGSKSWNAAISALPQHDPPRQLYHEAQCRGGNAKPHPARLWQCPPLCPSDAAKRGYAALCDDLERWLSAITGFAATSLQPNSGAQGEYAGLWPSMPTIVRAAMSNAVSA